ncbi:MAG: hypothetical protein CO184_01920 [Candidatus Zambryskibacteria bacterium CG_4_9_14_3_um_filter_40_16]|uniref:Uncharacterized protein n=1 Tax=Candidatus Zambryskibacteria bacterium CG_4_9_14_3_um_filter_40_16 TaxID=1975111 RepID=A0A2M7WTX2_9BACT|nr:MAG: hypothetical protein CO184_01920 [Candidatus Zambryskibacteria bacterium CG_4_9_14_3_um_filter_40_16]
MKTKITKSNIQTVSKKHFQKDGKWIVKPTKTEILLCKCGNKYIKTREGQKNCVRCLESLS